MHAPSRTFSPFRYSSAAGQRGSASSAMSYLSMASFSHSIGSGCAIMKS